MNKPLNEDKALRQWMEENYGGLREDRSTASYALEFLKTERHNRAMHSARANLTMAVEQLDNVFDWVEKSFDEILRLEKENPGNTLKTMDLRGEKET